MDLINPHLQPEKARREFSGFVANAEHLDTGFV